MVIDSHAHLLSEEFSDDIRAVLDNCKANGVSKIINICGADEEIDRISSLSPIIPDGIKVYHAAAHHPHRASLFSPETFNLVEEAAKNGLLVAIGETGLDYCYNNSSKEDQFRSLISYFQLALKYKLPVAIHCREAFEDFFSLLDTHYITNGTTGPGVLHCFTGTEEEALQVLQRGFHISFSGIITFKNGEPLRKIAEKVPLDKLLVETDCPFLAPTPHRGRRNEPAYVVEVVKTLALVKGLSFEEMSVITSNNANKLFNLK